MALDKYFPVEEGIEIIAEPGRYMVASAFTLGVNIIAKRVVARDQHGESKFLKSFSSHPLHTNFIFIPKKYFFLVSGVIPGLNFNNLCLVKPYYNRKLIVHKKLSPNFAITLTVSNIIGCGINANK